MKMNIKTLAALAAFSAVAFSAHAQVLASGDVAVGFKSTDSTKNLIVAAGSVTTLAGFTTETLIGNFDTQLNGNGFTGYGTTIGGAAVNWGAAGTITTTPKVDFITKQWGTAAGTLGTQNSVAWGSTSQSTVNSGSTSIAIVYTGFNGAAATATGDGLSKTIAVSNTNSWSTANTSGTSAFGVFNPNANGFNTAASRLANGEVFSASDLYQVAGGVTTFLGTFALYTGTDGIRSAGDLTFTAAAAAIPEPSTYAAILGAAVLGFVMIRRRNQAAIV